MASTEQLAESPERPAWIGNVAGIFIGPVAAEPMQAVPAVRAVQGRGLEGDRYFERVGTYSDRPGTGREVTLIESEAVEAAGRDYGLRLGPGDPRRNVVTSGVSLTHLVDQQFMVGECRLRRVRL